MKKLICALMCAVMLLGLTPSVFALKNGDVSEQGTFEELMAQKGYFYSLFTVSQQ